MSLELSILYEYELKNTMKKILRDDKYKYYFTGNYYDYNFTVPEDSWNNLQMVSIKDGEIIGLLGAFITRNTNSVSDLYFINFKDINYTYSKDMRDFIVELFEKYNFNKINFRVVIGNPIEKMYDKYIEKYGGRIIGIRKDEVRLIDGKLYDDKLYEITKDEYLKSKEKLK